MEILERICLLLLLFLVILDNFRRFFLMDRSTCLEKLSDMESSSGCGFQRVLFLFFLVVVVLFVLRFQFLRINGCFLGFTNFLYDYRRDSGVLSKVVSSKSDLDVKSSSKIKSLMCKLLDETKEKGNKAKTVENDEVDEGVNDGDCWEKEWYDEESEFDVLRLRKLVKIERERADKACFEFEMERLAAASASEEAMSMILRLQTEKSLIELEARQYRRLAEEKEVHNREVINSLQWLVLKHETERCLMRNECSSCKQKLKVIMQSDEGDHLEHPINHGISISLDLDLSS